MIGARPVRVIPGYASLMLDFPFDEVDDDGPGVWIMEERPPLREGKVFVDYDERSQIAEYLETAWVALNRAFRGVWVPKALELGQVREYWDDSDIDELEVLTLDANAAVERAWQVLSAVVEAHTAQEETVLGTDDD